MSKKNKMLTKLCKIPPPKDFRWDDLVTVMRQAAYEETCESGSHYIFEHRSGFRFSMSKTHPEGILLPYQVKNAKIALRKTGFIEDKDSV